MKAIKQYSPYVHAFHYAVQGGFNFRLSGEIPMVLQCKNNPDLVSEQLTSRVTTIQLNPQTHPRGRIIMGQHFHITSLNRIKPV